MANALRQTTQMPLWRTLLAHGKNRKRRACGKQAKRSGAHPSHTIRATPSAEPAANAATTGPGPKRLSSHRLGGSLPVRPKLGDDSAAAPAPARATAMNPLEQRTFFLPILPSLNCLQALPWHWRGDRVL